MPELVPIAGQLIVGAVVSTGVGAVSRLVAGSDKPSIVPPSAPKLSTVNAQQLKRVAADPLNVEAAIGGPHTGIFGRRRIGGKIAFSATDSSGRTHLNIVLAGAPIGNIDGLYINGIPVGVAANGVVQTSPWGAGAIGLTYYTGSQGARDPILGAAFAAYNQQYVGRLLTYVRLSLNPAVANGAFNAGTPDFTFLVSGHPNYDPRDEAQSIANPATWGVSSNPAILAANYLTHPLGGGSDFKWADIDLDSIAAAADICDEDVALAGGQVEPRYQASLVWQTDERHENVLARIGAAMGGGLFLVGKKFRASVGVWNPPDSVPLIQPRDQTGQGVSWSETPTLADSVNGVRGTFASPAHGYEPRDFPNFQDATALAQDDSRERWLDLDLSCVHSHTQAQRLARIAYNKARKGFPARVQTTFDFFDTVADDIVQITDDLAGFSNTYFRVHGEEVSPQLDIVFNLQHERSDFYDWNEATDEKPFIAEPPILSAAVAGTGGGTTTSGTGWTSSYDAQAVLAAGGAFYTVSAGGNHHPVVLVYLSPMSPGYSVELLVYYTYRGSSLFNGVLTLGARDSFSRIEGPVSQSLLADPITPLIRVGQTDAQTENMSCFIRTIKKSTGETTAYQRMSTNVDLVTLAGYNASNTPYYALPSGGTPVASQGAGNTINLTVPHASGANSDFVELYASSTPEPSGAGVYATLNNTGNPVFNYPYAPGTTKYFWSRVKSSSGKRGPYSNVNAVVFN